MLYKVLVSGLGLSLCLWTPFVIIGQPDIIDVIRNKVNCMNAQLH